MLIAQLSDPHIGATAAGKPHGMAPQETLARGVAALLALHRRPEVVVVSGDLVETGTPDEYALLRTLLAPLPMPVYLMTGNHDERTALRAAFPEHAYLGSPGSFVQYGFDAGAWRVLMLDSLEPGRASGHLCATRLAWLAGELDRARDRPVVVFVHHCPLVTGAAHIDRSRLLDGDALAAVLRRHPRVERVLCGHVHRAMHAAWAGTVVTTCPSVFYQFVVDLRAAGRFAPAAEAPGYQLHDLRGGCLLSYTIGLV
ncbi:MAG: phosphodiesterase [Burkholderiales bacterium]|nr:phosphodiesterase [Burkholderiales bacterium]